MLSDSQIDDFRRRGHLTVNDVFTPTEIEHALDDIQLWGTEFLKSLPEEKRDWYLERAETGMPALRKLDNPVFHRPVFRRLAKHPALVEMVEQLIGSGVCVFFSQVFMKPPEVGGEKPIHQDNFYFGPDNPDATLTVWIALDDATIENGCLYYCDQHQSEIEHHIAPDDAPFNLQIPASVAQSIEMSAAPVPRGGVSFHHGNTPHQSSDNRSPHPRRAAAMHYLRNDARLTRPALEYNEEMIVSIT